MGLRNGLGRGAARVTSARGLWQSRYKSHRGRNTESTNEHDFGEEPASSRAVTGRAAAVSCALALRQISRADAEQRGADAWAPWGPRRPRRTPTGVASTRRSPPHLLQVLLNGDDLLELCQLDRSVPHPALAPTIARVGWHVRVDMDRSVHWCCARWPARDRSECAREFQARASCTQEFGVRGFVCIHNDAMRELGCRPRTMRDPAEPFIFHKFSRSPPKTRL